MIGPTFGGELAAAGLVGLPICWSADGTVSGRENLTPAQLVILDQVIAAHNPTKPSPGDVRAQSFNDDPDRIDLLQRLRTATPAQINTWVDINVTSLAAARTVLKAIIKVIALDARS